MSPLSWFQRVFVPRDGAPDLEKQDEDGTGPVYPGLEDSSSFVSSQHMRIVLAIAVVFISAFVLWWIVA